MTDGYLLKCAIKKAGYKLTAVADFCGISYSSLRNKLTGRTEFSASEIFVLADLLKLSEHDIKVIFFSPGVDKMAT